MILAEYTPIFTWLRYLFQPILSLCQVPEVAAVALSMPVGIAGNAAAGFGYERSERGAQ